MSTNPLTIDDLLMVAVDNRAKEFPPTVQELCNGDELLKRINALQEMFNTQFRVSSGYRPGPYNVKAHGAAHSAHLTCEAIDLHDVAGSLKHKLMSNRALLEQFDLYMEWPDSTPGWLHLQTRRPGSGSRVFKP